MKAVRFISPYLLLFIFLSCSNSRDDPQELNFRQYFYPVEKLWEPSVYCYVDSRNNGIRYEKIQSFIEGNDTVITITKYDSVFNETLFEKDLINEVEFKILDEYTSTYDSINHPLKTYIKYRESSVKWKHELGGNIAYTHSATSSFADYQIAIKEVGHFEEVTDSIVDINFNYSTSDCIKLKSDYTFTIDKEVNGQSTFNTSYETYFSKNIGPIYYIENDFTNSNERGYALQKIITLKEFENLTHKNRNSEYPLVK